jgi:hypothetical protein
MGLQDRVRVFGRAVYVPVKLCKPSSFISLTLRVTDMIRKYKVELEVVITNKGNLISEAYNKHNYKRKPYAKITVEDALQLVLECASHHIDVQKTIINETLPLE